METNDAPDLREALEKHRFMRKDAPDFSNVDALAEWLNSVSSAAFLSGARHEQIYQALAEYLQPHILAALSRNEEAGERHPGWTEAGHAWLDAGAPLTPKATPPSDHIASPEGTDPGGCDCSAGYSMQSDHAPGCPKASPSGQAWSDVPNLFEAWWTTSPNCSRRMIGYSEKKSLAFAAFEAGRASVYPAQQSGELREAHFQIGDEVEIIPEEAGAEWQGEPPHYIAGIDWHGKHGVTYTTSETWPPRWDGLRAQGLTDEWLERQLRRRARAARLASTTPAQSREWPADAEFQFGQHVTTPRKPFWEGVVCGWYRNAEGRLGFNVEATAIPGAIHNYPQTGLRLASTEAPVSGEGMYPDKSTGADQ